MKPAVQNPSLFEVIKDMKRHPVVIGTSVLVIFAVVVLTVYLYLENKAGALIQFEEHQGAQTQHLAHQIRFFFQARSEELRVLSLFASRQDGDVKKRKADMQSYSRMMEYAKAFVIYTSKGEITYATDAHAIGFEGGDPEILSWAKRRENRGKVLCLPIVQPDSFMLLFAVPVYQGSPETKPYQSNGKFSGVIATVVDFREFLSRQANVVGFCKNKHGVWLLDRDGALLFPSVHTETAKTSIGQRDENCQECHPAFDHIEKVLEKKQGAVVYPLRNSPQRIATFAPMDFEETSWIVVVTSSYDEVAAFVRKSLWEHLAFLAVVVLTSLLGTAFVIRTDRLKVQAEEKFKHIEEKRDLESRIQQSEAQYRTIVENAHDAIWTVDTEGHITFVNRKGEEISGYRASELVGKNFESLIPADDRTRAQGLFVDILQGKLENFEQRVSAKDGKIRLLSVNAVPILEDGVPVGMVNIGRDITEHRGVEKALRESEKQLRYLSSQLLTAQETERRRISRELHDELGQALSVIKLRLGFIERMLKKEEVAAREECRSISQYINQVIENVRRLSRDLTPSILEDAGLLAAIRWLISSSKTNGQVKMILDVGDIDRSFSLNAQIMVYRILQEALTNIGKHARASKASVTIKEQGDGVSFCIEDDGIGFDVFRAVTVNPDERGLGLAIMEERARMLRGSLEILSEKGSGTRIILHVPLEKGGSV